MMLSQQEAQRSSRSPWAAGFDHPVIDSDAHLIEYLPDITDRVGDLGGRDLARRFERHFWTIDTAYRMPRGVSAHNGMSRPPWWNYPARNTLDRATAMLPRLMYERLPEAGIDVAVTYPSYFIVLFGIDDDEYRQVSLRATNQHVAELCAGLADRIIPVASIPMHTPEEALAELTYAHETLGFKAFVLPGVARRPLGTGGFWLDTFGVDSLYDYDPVWRFCDERGLAVTVHAPSMGWSGRQSPYNYMHNHVGHFGQAGHTIARGLLFGGVPTRYPNLRFAFLEGGLAWAASLYADLCSHYAKRNRVSIRNYDPVEMDLELARELFAKYATERIEERLDQLERAMYPLSAPMGSIPDEFAELDGGGIRDIKEIFDRQLFFGCEGDDRLNTLAGSAMAEVIGTRLNALFGSDIGHWDLPDIARIPEELTELVRGGHLVANDIRDLTFANPARLWAGNPTATDFFAGTHISAAVTDELACSVRTEGAKP